MRLRIKDVDFHLFEVRIRDGKGRKDRVGPFPRQLVEPLRAHIEKVCALHDADIRKGGGWVAVPDALATKFPNAGRSWAWHWVFPADRTHVDSATGEVRRHHAHEKGLQRAVHLA